MTAKTPSKIISGGQTGADRAALDFALVSGIKHGGWCPAGRRSEDGPIPTTYQLIETPGWGYEDRTARNVRESDATLLFNRGHALSAGTAMTVRFCEKLGRPFVTITMPHHQPDVASALGIAAKQVADFLAWYQPGTLNVAGNRERTAPGIGDFVKSVLAEAWQIVPTLKAGNGLASELLFEDVGSNRRAASGRAR